MTLTAEEILANKREGDRMRSKKYYDSKKALILKRRKEKRGTTNLFNNILTPDQIPTAIPVEETEVIQIHIKTL
jgi:hypothetical protein